MRAMNILIFDSDEVVRELFDASLPGHAITYFEGHVTPEILAAHPETEAVSLFVSSALPRESIDLLPALKLIVARSTGFDHIDTAYAASKGVAVVTVPHYGGHTVAEFAFALLLSVSRRIPEAIEHVRAARNFSTRGLEGFDLFGKTLGIIGTGNIGRNVATIAAGFGMETRLFDLFPDRSIETERSRYVSFDELLALSDVITLHTPYTPANRHLLNADAFGKMKRGAVIINTARGELVDTAALLAALKSGQVAGAGLDVLEGERDFKDEAAREKDKDSLDALRTLSDDEMLITMPQVVITPHVAFSTREAYREILSTSIANIRSFQDGAPQNALRQG